MKLDYKKTFFVVYDAFSAKRLEFYFFDIGIIFFRKGVYCHKSGVVTCILVLKTRISESDNDIFNRACFSGGLYLIEQI